MNTYFFKTPSKIVDEKGPTAKEQLEAMATNKYWIVLNSHFLADSGNDILLRRRASAFKHALQTFGPTSSLLPDLRSNKGTEGTIFHGHVNNINGTTYVLEWAILNKKDRVMAITGFSTHENFKFKKEALKDAESKHIFADPKNIKTIENAELNIELAKSKVERVNYTYRHC